MSVADSNSHIAQREPIMVAPGVIGVVLGHLYFAPPLVLLVTYLLYFLEPSRYHVLPTAETSMLIGLTVVMGLMVAALPKVYTKKLVFQPKKWAVSFTISIAFFWFMSSAAMEKLPLLSLLDGDMNVSYLEFGYFSAFGHSIIVFATFLAFFHMPPSRVRVFLVLGLLSLPVFMVSRFVLVEQVFLLLIYVLSNWKSYRFHALVVVGLVIYGLGFISNLRTPVAYLAHYWLLADWMVKLPTLLMWGILYTTAPIMNLVHFIGSGYGGYTEGYLTLKSLLPGFASEHLNGLLPARDVWGLLYFPLNTVYTFFGKYYLDFGAAGLLCSMLGLVLAYRYCIGSLDWKARSLFVYPAVCVFFSDIVVFFPTLLLFAYLALFCRIYTYAGDR